MGLDVEVHPKVVLAVHNGPAPVVVHAHCAQHVAHRLQLGNDGVTGVANLEADVVHPVAVLVEELAERGGVVVRLVQLDNEASLLAVDDRELEFVGGDLATVDLVRVRHRLSDADLGSRRVEQLAPGVNRRLDVLDHDRDLYETRERDGVLHEMTPNAPIPDGTTSVARLPFTNCKGLFRASQEPARSDAGTATHSSAPP